MVQRRQEGCQLSGGAVPVDGVDDLEQGRPGDAPGDQHHGVQAAGDDLGKERDVGATGQRGQDADLMGDPPRRLT